MVTESNTKQKNNESALLKARDVKKYFPITAGLIRDHVIGWVKALDGVSLSLSRRQVVGLVGESGSGKTTLAKIFLLLERATGGEVLFEGENLYDFKGQQLKAYRRKVHRIR